MNLSAYEIALIGGGFALVGVFIGALINYYFSVRLMKRHDFNKAATDFRVCFIDQIRFIDRDYAVDRTGRDIPKVLSDAADRHETALIIFKDGFLCKNQRAKMEKAWKEYTGEKKTMGKYTFEQYATHGNLKDGESIRKLARSRIENLLKFADPKY